MNRTEKSCPTCSGEGATGSQVQVHPTRYVRRVCSECCGTGLVAMTPREGVLRELDEAAAREAALTVDPCWDCGGPAHVEELGARTFEVTCPRCTANDEGQPLHIALGRTLEDAVEAWNDIAFENAPWCERDPAITAAEIAEHNARARAALAKADPAPSAVDVEYFAAMNDLERGGDASGVELAHAGVASALDAMARKAVGS